MSDAVSEDDARDLALCRAGDHDAFGRLYDRHAAVVLSVCRQAGMSLVEADDACQETFIRAHRLLGQLEPDRAAALQARSWLCAIGRKVCSERRRAAARRTRHEGHAMTHATLAHPHPETARDGISSSSLHDQLEQLTLALDRLPDDQRLAIHLYYLDADPVRAAEAALGISRSGYYKLLGRARDALAALMGAAPASPTHQART